MFSQDRESIRGYFIAVWNKYLQKKPLEPLEQQVLAVILEHPEYHELLSDMESALTNDYPPEAGKSNPFLHMGMHIAIREQVGINRPPGIAAIYESLVMKTSGDTHAAEHLMLECLGESLWHARNEGMLPDETGYMDCLRRCADGDR